MQTIKDHLHKSGKHTAELSTSHNQPVTHETVKPTEEQNVSRAVDREVHETHHQTEVLPVNHKVVQETQHHENVMPVEHRQQHHGQDSKVKEKLAGIAGAFHDKQHTHDTTHTKGEDREIVGEHRHHHVHETIQPVIQQETIQPHVVHTTVPIHERVDLEPTVHNATVAKPMSMDQFKSQVGVGGGEQHETINYAGDPLSINKDADVGFGQHGHHHGQGTGLTSGTTGQTGFASGGAGMGQAHSGTGMTGGTATGPHSSGMANKMDPRVDSDRDGRSGLGGTTTGSGLTGSNTGHHHHSGTGVGASAGALAGATAATQHHRDQTGTSSGVGHTGTHTSGLGHSNRDQQGTIGSVASTLGDRDGTSHHNKSHGDVNRDGLLSHGEHRDHHHTTGGSTTMPGAFVDDNSRTTGTTGGIGHGTTGHGTTGHGTTGHSTTGHGVTGHGGAVDSNATGFMDGRSPNDNKSTEKKEESGGLISGLINKMKS